MEQNTGGISPSPEDGNRCNFRKVSTSGFLEQRSMDKAKESSNSGVKPCTLSL
jgi:hypothetical protein